ncbi:hypothetical protein [Photorhabdus luminescens]|uniref:Phage tail tape measure protein n=1 Tax=Photorhabdus luminescens subsp. mexicana TaxID=2100167 RepID=A0A4R4IRE5_PHOLU|nr:hypothetical protein [Photorhabdus luminescens]TDB43288.1 hypothetical protein C5468_23965 [Photorhabdus luminescens subsp. mexicana]
MTTKNRAEFIVNLVGNVTQKSRQFGASIRRFGTEGSRSMRLFSSAVTGANGILDKFDNRMVGFVTGGGLAMAGKQIADHQQTITELGTTYNLTADQVMKLDAAVTKVAAHRKLSTADLTTGAEAFMGKTNDFEATLAQLDNIALSINGIKMEASAAGNELGGMFNVGFKSPEKMRKWLDSVVSASKEGTGNIGDQLAALRGLGKDTKWQSQLDQQQMLAMLRIANAEFNDPEQAVSAMQGFYDVINDKEKQKILKRKGRINVKDKKGQFKHPVDLMFEIGTAAKNKKDNLEDVFDGDTLKFAMVFADVKKRDLVKKLAHPNNIEEGLLEKKATQNVQTFNGALTSLMNTGERFAQLKLAKPVQDLADAIHSLTPEELDEYAAAVEKAAYAIGAAVAARYAWRGYKKLSDMLKGPGGTNSTSNNDKLGAGDSDVVPVYVTNWSEQGQSDNNNGYSNNKSKFNRGGLIGAVINTVSELEALLPSGEEKKATFERWKKQMKEEYPHAYDKNGQERGSKLFPISLKEWWYKRNDQIVNEGLKPSPYLTGNWEQKSPPSLAEPANPQPQPQQNPQKSPEGKIVIQVETTGDIKAKTKSVKAENVDLRVNTGYSYGRSY